MTKQVLFLCVVFFTTILTSCGGSGGGGDDSPRATELPSPVEDTTPTAFSFSSERLVEPGSVVQSQSITIDGINTSTSISVQGGEYRIDEGEFTTEDGQISNGQSVQLRAQAPDNFADETQVTLTVGGVSARFVISTRPTVVETIRVEAETGLGLGNSAVINVASASGEQVLGNMVETNDGISLQVPQESIALVLHYSLSDTSGLSLVEYGTEAMNIELASTENTDTYVMHRTNIVLDENSELTLRLNNDVGEMRLDYVDFIPDPFQFVHTYGTTTTGVDGIAVHPNGDIYVSGSTGAGNSAGDIIRIAPDLTSEVIASGLNGINGLDFDSQGSLFAASFSHDSVYRISPDGSRTVFASDLDGPAGLAIDDQDNVYVGLYGKADRGNAGTVLRFTPEGEVSTYAQGQGLRGTVGVAIDENGEVYTGNFHAGELFRVTDGVVELIASTGAQINMFDYANGYIYIPDSINNRIVRVNTRSSDVEVFSGGPNVSAADGQVTQAGFYSPSVVAFSADEREMFIVEFNTGNIREINSTPTE